VTEQLHHLNAELAKASIKLLMADIEVEAAWEASVEDNKFEYKPKWIALEEACEEQENKCMVLRDKIRKLRAG
tara:strand:- start:390 stop:608 length:219 start_codon:yes stop_codon:yes gene_type:complete